MGKTQYVILFGTISNGFAITGPFDFIDDATEYAKLHYPDTEQWEVIEMLQPET